MARRNRPKREEHVPLDLNRASGGRRVESKRGEDWIVQEITAERALKQYSCPGCVLSIEPGVPHLVCWQSEGFFGEDASLADRRHWHRDCWRIF